MNRYDDIINLPHHVSKTRPQMSRHDRAAQFAPFAALVGYEAEIAEVARNTAERKELDPQAQAELNRKIEFLKANPSQAPEVTIEYFIPDKYKSGGAYHTVTGVLTDLSEKTKTLVIDNVLMIPAENIIVIDGELFCQTDMF